MIRGMGFSILPPQQAGPYADAYVLPSDVAPPPSPPAVLKKPAAKKAPAKSTALVPKASTALALPGPLANLPRWALVLGGLGLVALVWYVTKGKKGGRRRGRRPFGG